MEIITCHKPKDEGLLATSALAVSNSDKTEISFSIKEGDIIQLINGEYYPDVAATKDRKRRLAALQDSLFSD